MRYFNINVILQIINQYKADFWLENEIKISQPQKWHYMPRRVAMQKFTTINF